MLPLGGVELQQRKDEQMEERDLLGKPACVSLGMNELLVGALNTYSLVLSCRGGNRSSALFLFRGCKTAGEKKEFGSIFLLQPLVTSRSDGWLSNTSVHLLLSC